MSVPRPFAARSLPQRLSLTQLKKQAKDLLKAYRAGEPAAVAEVAHYERHPDPVTFSLVDAQRVLARAYGFASWAKLKERVDVLSNVDTFCQAVEAGDVDAVRMQVKERPGLLQQWSDRSTAPTALHSAVLRRDAGMTRALMELGADARTGVWPHRDATTPFIIARERGYDDIVAVIEQVEERRRETMSPAGATIDLRTDEILRAIREGRCDDAIRSLESDLSLIGACDVRGATPLHIAAWKHNPEMVRWLIDHGGPVDARFGATPLSRAACDEGAGKTPLDYAAIVAGWSSHGRDFSFLENSRLDPARFNATVQLLRSHGATLTPRAAVAVGDQQAVREMHHAGRLTNEIHLFRGGLLSITVRVNRPEMVSLLLDLGLDPDEATIAEDGHRSWGMPLWFAAMCGRCEIAELLLSRGADVNAIVYACGDALSIADRTQDEPMQALLLRHGARLTVEHVAGYGDRELAKAILEGTIPAQSLNVAEPTPADLAEQMLWAAGGVDAEIVRLCLPHISRPPDDPWWNYVLVHAKLPESVKLLLEHGVDPDVIGGGGYTILHHLATDYADDETRVARATLLLDAGASLGRRDPLLQSTPLGWACRWGRGSLVELYLARGADAVETDTEPWARPLAWAMKGGHAEIVELLRSRGGGASI